jgi:hypothetical protein
MNKILCSSLLMLMTGILIIASSCSTSETVIPTNQDSMILPLSLVSQTVDNPKDHLFMGIWDADFDLLGKSVAVSASRETAAHYQITGLIPPPQITINSIGNQLLDVDVTIQNPYPVDVYDVRLIIYTDSIGHVLSNADSWTPLYDISGGLPVNPFKAFMRNDPSRKFPGQTEQTVNCLITAPGDNYSIKFALEASYPGNCEEPYEIRDFNQGVLYEQVGSSTDVNVTVLDWQTDTSSVYLYCPVITGTDFLPFAQVTQENWGVELVNETGATVGSYQAFIIAFSSNSGNNFLANRVMIQVTSSTAGGWARSWGGESFDKVLCVTTDSQDNIITGGLFFGTVDFDPGSGSDIHSSSGEDDIFLCKYNKEGNFLWAKTWGSTLADRDSTQSQSCSYEFEFPYRGVVTDSNDNIYVTGSFQGTVDFDPGNSIYELTSNGGCDIYLSKFDQAGEFLNAVSWGGQNSNTPHEAGLDLTVDLKQNVYITGYYLDIVDFDPGSGEDWHNASTGAIFSSKFDSNLNFVWAKTWGGSTIGKNTGNAVSLDSSGNIFIVGKFKGGSADFDPGDGLDIHTSTGTEDAFISKFNIDGDFQWAKTWSQAYFDEATDVITDISGNIYISGQFDGEGDFDPGPNELILDPNYSMDSFLSKFDTNGNLVWALAWGSGNKDRSKSLTINKNSSQYIYVTTTYSNTIDLDPSMNEDFYDNPDGTNTALSKFDLNGNYIWGRSWDGLEDIYFSNVCLDSNGNIIGSGCFYYEIDFDPGSSVDNHISNGETDAFLVKILPNGYWE